MQWLLDGGGAAAMAFKVIVLGFRPFLIRLMAKKAPVQFAETSMRGEGLPVNVQFETTPDGKTESRFQLNVLGAPERVFFSDAIAIREERLGTRIGFVQRDFSGKKARALLDIYMPFEALDQLRATLTNADFDKIPAEMDVEMDEEPSNSIAYQANFVRLARGGLSACADFYYASPYGLINGDKRGSAYFEPVVRVTATDGVFSTLISYFKKED